MSTSAAQFQFAAEFVAFLVGAAGVALVLLGADLLSRVAWVRALLALGFAGLVAASFAHGSLLVGEDSRGLIAAVRGAGLLCAALGSVRWRGGAASRQLLWAGLAVTGAPPLLGVPAPRTGAHPKPLVVAVGIGAFLAHAPPGPLPAPVSRIPGATLLLLRPAVF